MIYLYVKTHNKTGMKYLGKTSSKNPHYYRGSGILWKRHIDKHGYDVKTEILLATECKLQIKHTGLFFSKLFNVVNSKEWANLTEENGAGGDLSEFINREKTNVTLKKKYGDDVTNVSQVPSVKEKIKNALKGVPKSKSHKNNMKKPKSEQGKKNIKNARLKAIKENPEFFRLLAINAGKGNKGNKQREEWKNKRINAIRKTYKIGDLIITNAKDYCNDNGYNYIMFTQAAKNKIPYKGMIIEVIK